MKATNLATKMPRWMSPPKPNPHQLRSEIHLSVPKPSDHPPRKTVTMSADPITIAAYSPMKNIANFMEEYSV